MVLPHPSKKESKPEEKEINFVPLWLPLHEKALQLGMEGYPFVEDKNQLYSTNNIL